MSLEGRTFVTQSISFPPQLLASIKERAFNLGLSLSAYVQKCLENDLETRPAIIFDEKGPGYGVRAQGKAPGKRRVRSGGG